MYRLYHLDRSPYGWKTRIVVAEKNVPVTLVIPENKTEDAEFARKNPFKLTPVLELPDGKTIYESTVINEYLEEAHPAPAMLPKDPWERARVRMIEDTTDQYFFGALRTLVLAQFEYQPPHLLRKPASAVDMTAVEEGKKKVYEHLQRLEGELQGRTWFGGEIFSLADAALVAPLAERLPMLGILPDARYPRLLDWTRRALERPSVASTRPKQPLTIKEG